VILHVHISYRDNLTEYKVEYFAIPFRPLAIRVGDPTAILLIPVAFLRSSFDSGVPRFVRATRAG
jgi:hypothetical protein